MIKRDVIKGKHVRVDGAGPRPPAATQPEARRAPHDEGRAPGAASVRLLWLDENTQALELTCACGEVSLIEIRTEKKP